MVTLRECRGTKYRVLVVDDHPRARDMLTMLVCLDSQRLDVQPISEVGSGEEAVAQASVYKPHVVLMDIGLPGISGLEAARKVKEETPSIEIVMVTAWEDPDYREAATKMGAAGFLSKGEVGMELVPLLARVLSQWTRGEDGSA